MQKNVGAKELYPRTGDYQTVYLKNVVTDSSITVGEYTMYNDFVNDPKEFQKNNVLYHYQINHDKLMSSVTIGDGAIVGARAIVTKDIPPYTIVGGIPATPIRKRFSREVITSLLEIKWWEWSYERIRENISAIQSGNIHDLK